MPLNKTIHLTQSRRRSDRRPSSTRRALRTRDQRDDERRAETPPPTPPLAPLPPPHTPAARGAVGPAPHLLARDLGDALLRERGAGAVGLRARGVFPIFVRELRAQRLKPTVELPPRRERRASAAARRDEARAHAAPRRDRRGKDCGVVAPHAFEIVRSFAGERGTGAERRLSLTCAARITRALGAFAAAPLHAAAPAHHRRRTLLPHHHTSATPHTICDASARRGRWARWCKRGGEISS